MCTEESLPNRRVLDGFGNGQDGSGGRREEKQSLAWVYGLIALLVGLGTGLW